MGLPSGRVAVTVRASRSKPVDLGELDLDVPLAAQHASDRRGDLALREDPGGDLVEQRLEEVVVVAVHQRHPDRAATQPARGEQPSEASAHDHDSMGLGGHRQSVKPPRRPDARAGGRPPADALAIAVSAGLTAPMLGKKLVSTT